MRGLLIGFVAGVILWSILLWGLVGHAQTPTAGPCGEQVSGMPQVLQFTSNNCKAVPPGPTAGTCWIAVVRNVPTFQCADGTLVKISTEAYP